LTCIVFEDKITEENEKKLMNRLILELGFTLEEVGNTLNKSFIEIPKGSR
tara:strand:+ start:2963 stop:3112 length:150 start_codon:yes stop_codon:yes gene_type:complete